MRPCKFQTLSEEGDIWLTGKFHQWDQAHFVHSPGSYLCAIVELDDGSVYTPPAKDVVFLNDIVYLED